MSKYKRFFSFGCSFTKYHWPTWADILGKSFPEYINLGRGGAGNFYIFKMLMEVIVQESINENDLVIICWSAINREDRFINGDWQTWGNIYSNKFYDDVFIEKYCDTDHFITRDLTFIAAAYELLEKTKCKFLFTSILPINENETMYGKKKNLPIANTNKDRYYLKYLDVFLPDFREVIFEGDWHNPKRPDISDNHPTPLEHLSYAENILLPNIDDDILLDEEYLKEIRILNEKILKREKL